MRDAGLLEAALFRPQTGHYTDLIEEAAALWESLAQNHPFADGNERTAFAATYTFLAIDGTRITADADETYAFIIDLYEAGAFHFARLVPWLRNQTSLDRDPPDEEGTHRSRGRPDDTRRINEHYRICFTWTPYGPEQVEIVDDH